MPINPTAPTINQPIDVQLPNFNAINASQAGKQTITATWPASYNFLDIFFVVSAQVTLAMIQQIRLKVNGTTLQTWSGADLDLRNRYDNMPAFAAATGVIMLTQRRLGIRGGVQKLNKTGLQSATAGDLGMIGTLNCGSLDGNGYSINALTCEIDLVNTGLTPTIQPFAVAMSPYPGGTGFMRWLDLFPFQGASGANTLAKNNGLIYADGLRVLMDRIYLIPQAAQTLDNFQALYNNQLIKVRTNVVNNFINVMDNLRTAINNSIYVIDFYNNGYGDEDYNVGLSSTDFRLLFTTSGAGLINVYQESLGYLTPGGNAPIVSNANNVAS